MANDKIYIVEISEDDDYDIFIQLNLPESNNNIVDVIRGTTFCQNTLYHEDYLFIYLFIHLIVKILTCCIVSILYIYYSHLIITYLGLNTYVVVITLITTTFYFRNPRPHLAT